jgi:hypothetical protein
LNDNQKFAKTIELGSKLGCYQTTFASKNDAIFHIELGATNQTITTKN